MIIVTFYYTDECDQCGEVEKYLEELRSEFPHDLVKINVNDDLVLKDLYSKKTPVLKIGPYTLSSPISMNDIKASLGAAQDRINYFEEIGDADYKKRYERGKKINGADRFSMWLSARYMLLFNLAMLLYVGLPFLAPLSLKIGITFPAKVVYTIYSPLCHQLAFRSWYLFGEQAFYPRELAGIEDLITYEEISNNESIDLFDARKFVGNEELGYKVALCQRDVAIYGSILIFGLMFSFSGRKIKPLKWYLWLLIGLIPIGLDGFSQLPGLANAILPSWIPARESTPILRTITGILFGITTAWYIYPLIEETMQETRIMLSRKVAVIEKTNNR